MGHETDHSDIRGFRTDGKDGKDLLCLGRQAYFLPVFKKLKARWPAYLIELEIVIVPVVVIFSPSMAVTMTSIGEY